MKNSLIYFVCGWMFLGAVFAHDESAMQLNEGVTIPFIFEKRPTVLPEGQKAPSHFYREYANDYKAIIPEEHHAIEERSEGIVIFAASELKNLIKTFKDDICQINPDGEFEINFKVDASGKFLGVGVEGEGGLNTIIKCVQSEDKDS